MKDFASGSVWYVLKMMNEYVIKTLSSWYISALNAQPKSDIFLRSITYEEPRLLTGKVEAA